MMVGPIQENKKHPPCEVLSCIRGAQHLGQTKRCLLRGHCLALGKITGQMTKSASGTTSAFVGITMALVGMMIMSRSGSGIKGGRMTGLWSGMVIPNCEREEDLV